MLKPYLIGKGVKSSEGWRAHFYGGPLIKYRDKEGVAFVWADKQGPLSPYMGYPDEVIEGSPDGPFFRDRDSQRGRIVYSRVREMIGFFGHVLVDSRERER